MSSPRPDSDPSDSDQFDSLVHLKKLSLSQIENDEDGSGYDDDQAFPHPLPHSNSYEGHRARSRTMTNGDRPHRRAPAAFVEVSESNVEQDRDETILFVQKNSHMIVAYRLKMKTPSEEYLEKLVSTGRSIRNESMVLLVLVVRNDGKNIGVGRTDLHDV